MRKRLAPHNPEVSGSNPPPATKVKPESVGLWFDFSPAHSGRHFSKNGGISYTPVRIRMNRSSPGLLISKSIDGFLKFKAAEGLSQRTITSYEYTLNHWLYQIGDRNVSEIEASDLTNYLAWLRTEYKPMRFKMIRAETLSFGSRGIPPFLSVQLSYVKRP